MEAGQYIQALHTQCGISYEKFPLACSLFLRMHFGAIDTRSRESIVLCSDTYSKYAAISMNALHRALHQRFSDRKAEDRFIMCCLQVDSSKAGSKNVTLKPMITLSASGKVELLTLNADFVFSKKGKASADHSLRSLRHESDFDFQPFLCGITCDAFGLTEATGIMTGCDNSAVAVHDLDPQLLVHFGTVSILMSCTKIYEYCFTSYLMHAGGI